MSVDQSGGLRMEIGVLYLSHAMLVLAESVMSAGTPFTERLFVCAFFEIFFYDVSK